MLRVSWSIDIDRPMTSVVDATGTLCRAKNAKRDLPFADHFQFEHATAHGRTTAERKDVAAFADTFDEHDEERGLLGRGRAAPRERWPRESLRDRKSVV